MKLNKEQFEEIVFASLNQSMELEFLLDIHTGEVILLNDDNIDEDLKVEIEDGLNEDYISLPYSVH